MRQQQLLTKTVCIAALTFVMLAASPVSLFAFRNPNVDPAETSRSADQSPARQAPGSADDGLQNSPDDDASGNYAAAILGAGEISSASRDAVPLRKASGFDAFNSRNRNQWQAAFSAQTGTIKRLYGSSSQPYKGTPEAGAHAFLQSSHALFGLKSGLADLTIQQVTTTAKRRHVRFQQTLNGAAIEGAQVIVHSDEQGRVTMVQNDSLDTVEPANEDTLAPEAARDIARDDLRVQLGPDANLSASTVEKIIARCSAEQRYVWKISTPAQNPCGLWIYHVDADSGEILYRGNEIFYLDTGKGRAYLTNEQWHAGRIANVSLRYMYTPQEGYKQGYIRGAHTTIIDKNGNYAFQPDLEFYYQLPGEKAWFDQVHAYYQKTTIREWWGKNIIKKYGPENMPYFYDVSIPTFVNYEGICNAFYTSDIDGNGTPGFAYGNENSCAADSKDLVIDNDVVRHEYTHAIMDWAGFDEQFGGDVNGYGRSMGEGNADWYAFLFSGDPEIGDVAWDWSRPAYLRNLDNTNMYPDDVDDPANGMPEEHYTGEIWGGYLYDLSRVLKKKAIAYVYNSSAYFSPSDGHRNGYPDFFDGIRAQADAEYDLTGSSKQTLAAFGSMASRGLNRPLSPVYSHATNYFGTGAAGSDSRWYLRLIAPVNLKTQGNVLLSGDPHEYPFAAEAGMVLTVKVSAKQGGLTRPSIQLYTIGGALLQNISTDPGDSSAALNFTMPSSGDYVVRITGTNAGPARGGYRLQMSVK